jgi:hypothetical protein
MEEESKQILNKALHILNDTTDIVNEINYNLSLQGETIERINKKTKLIDNLIVNAKNTLKKIKSVFVFRNISAKKRANEEIVVDENNKSIESNVTYNNIKKDDNILDEISKTLLIIKENVIATGNEFDKQNCALHNLMIYASDNVNELDGMSNDIDKII